MDDQQFRQLLDFFGLSWMGYRKVRKGVKKRLSRFWGQIGIGALGEFLQALDENKELRKQAEILMAVSISRFFRDRQLWQSFKKDVIPLVIAKHIEKVKVWSAGCACGEEVYSFKILWEEWGKSKERLPELELWATDLNPEVLDKAREGVYPLSSLKELPPEIRSKYFRSVQETRLAISDSLKEGIFWKIHNILIDDPPQADFQIIFLRNNLLTYYKDKFRKPAFRKVIDSLSAEGFLIIGSHEKLLGDYPELRPFPYHPNIFQKPPFLPSPLGGRRRW
jgi:chemotaxis protein methyltransferase CheR